LPEPHPPLALDAQVLLRLNKDYETELNNLKLKNQELLSHIAALTSEKGQLVVQIGELSSKYGDLERQFLSLQTKHEAQKSHIGQIRGTLKLEQEKSDQLQNTLVSTQKKFACASSKISGLKNKINSGGKSISNSENNAKQKTTACRCSGRDDEDIICVKSYTDTSCDDIGSSCIFEGTTLAKVKGDKIPKNCSGTFVRISTSKKNSDVCERELRRRSNLVFLLCRLVSGADSQAEIISLWVVLMKRMPKMFSEAAQKAGLALKSQALSVVDTVNLRCLLRMPMTAFRKLRTNVLIKKQITSALSFLF